MNIAAVALVASVGGNANATTLTFNAGASNNTAVGSSYGTDNTADNVEFITSDGSGTTPNIALLWPGAALEFHSDTRWADIEEVSNDDPDTHILQMNQSQSNRTIQFTPDAGWSVLFNSVDFGFGTGMSAASSIGTVTITRDFDSSVVKTVSTGTLNKGTATTLDLTYTGLVGESYTLEFTSSVSENWGAIDDLSFSQTAVPEPSSAALLGLGGLALILRRRK